MISKYLRDYKRLKIDIRHEYEQKTLALKQRLENDIYENELAKPLAELSIPIQPSALLSIPHNTGTINVSFSNQSNQLIQQKIDQIVNGDITYNAEDSQLVALFEKYAEHLESIRLKSALDELKDNSSPRENRQTARQKIAEFLYKIAPMVGESVIKVLITYIEQKVSGL